MNFLEHLSDILCSVITPCILLAAFLIILPYSVKSASWHLSRKREKELCLSKKSVVSQLSALSMALAGTLGVGNITGVASALIYGGPGAVFWMWIGALISTVVKYAEVYLAVRYRQRDESGWFGGAMYYIKYGLQKLLSGNRSGALGRVFAFLCIANSLVTGNIVQSNAAASVMSGNRAVCGAILAVLLTASILYGSRKIEKITAKLMPPLTLLYMSVAVIIIIKNISLVPEVFSQIVNSAFCGASVAGGAIGFSVRESLRFGVIRGIFSNESGCGTSPTAHAVADCSSPASQGRLGIAEVVFDTIVLCSMTAFVLLIADAKYSIIPWSGIDSDAAAVTMEAFTSLTGNYISVILTASIILFAYASIIAQLYYGIVAIESITKKRCAVRLYYFISVCCTIIGSITGSSVMWISADLLIGLMTVMNCTVLILLRRQLQS